MSPHFLRPSPVLHSRAPIVPPDVPPEAAAARLARGDTLRLVDHYGRGADILDALDAELGPMPQLNGEALRKERRRRRTLAAGLLVPVTHDRVDLPGGGSFSLLTELYPDHHEFWLPLVEARALHSSHRRFAEGVHFPVLGHRLHPWHGVYAPHRSTHLELFATWLSQHDGPRDHAIDVGTGCGVLAFMLARSRFSRVTATDVNPNAVHSVRLDVARHTPRPSIQVRQGDLLARTPQPADVIVFNPPWIPGAVDDPLDRALYYDDDLFERFFMQARTALQPHGRVVVVFSTVSQLLRPDLPHPIEAELSAGRFVLDAKLQRRVKASKGRRTRERVEIWVLAQA